MISPQEIRLRGRKLWDSGRPLRATLTHEPLFPYTLSFRKPTAREWLEQFAQLREASLELEKCSRGVTGSGYSMTFVEVAHQKLGNLRVPERVSFETVEDLAGCIGERVALQRFEALVQQVTSKEPRLLEWIQLRPLRALDCESVFPRLLAIVAYFQAHPRPLCFARELRIPGVDSKFVEDHRAVLAEWLDQLLPAEAIDSSARPSLDGGFERRYGIRREEPLIRFRWLDSARALGGAIRDATVPVSHLAAYAPSCTRVLVTENKINFLTLPSCVDTLAILGGGYAIELLGQIPWLACQPLYYWGDLDTHGFAILSRIRRHYPHTRSFLMDHATLLAHRELWTQEPANFRSLEDLQGLDDGERTLYDALRNNHLGERVRLEQERVTYSAVEEAIAAFV